MCTTSFLIGNAGAGSQEISAANTIVIDDVALRLPFGQHWSFVSGFGPHDNQPAGDLASRRGNAQEPSNKLRDGTAGCNRWRRPSNSREAKLPRLSARSREPVAKAPDSLQLFSLIRTNILPL